ncbi:superoxide dismutase family protein [Confluentibacter flavum]|uniref:Superoxide dismutase [Cu-Zn] n=1 Tax=Confluentibacter flavum TaxID=1909700 RepID=A0A2N3HN85_9FLAO|nr:superoxide dismutase family protein [Confluentibacter flavum]PKQ46406.1 superoxide dismutase [Confluentibacter flavum]
MRKLSYIIILTALSLAACKNEKKQEPVMESDTMETGMEAPTSKELNITLNPKSESSAAGTIIFKEENGTVNLHAMITGLTPGEHAIHIHEKSDCSAPDGTSAGGHWNPTNQPHGKWGAETGYHKGDIGNFTADENGNGMVMFTTDEWCIGCDDDSKNIIGKGVIVHAGTDDFTTQPTGDAGGRVSCAGIIE